jgi:integrase
LKIAYRDNKRYCQPKSKKIKKSACIADDVVRIIGAIPELIPTKAEESSIILFALYTGARAISAVNLLIGDLDWKIGVL